MKRLLGIFAITIMMSGCNVNDDPASEMLLGDEIKFTTASTRVAYADAENALTLSWVKGDGIGITTKRDGVITEENYPFVALQTAATTGFERQQDKIRWDETTQKYDFYAYYPYAAGELSDPTHVSTTLAAEQQVSGSGIGYLAKNTLLYATLTDVVKSESPISLTFTNAFAVVGLRVSANRTVDITRLTVRFTDENEVAAAENIVVDITDGSLDFSEATSTSNSVNLDCNMMIPAGGESVAYLTITPGHGAKTMEVLATIADETKVIATKTLSADGIPAGKTAMLSAAVVVDQEQEKSVIDLSADGTANCYIINRPETTYKLRADVMGNGATTANITPSTLAPKGARLLKQYLASGNYKGGTEDGWGDDTMCKLILSNSVQFLIENDVPYIYFTTPATLAAGNAIMAATDDAGNVLWSWHLWVTPDYALGMGDVKLSANAVCSGVVMMDRNLGALSAGPSSSSDYSAVLDARAAVGMAYQWGRKDPFAFFTVGELPYNNCNGYYQNADGSIDKIRDDGAVYGVWSDGAVHTLTSDEAPTIADALAIAVANPHKRYKGYNSAYTNAWCCTDQANSDVYKSLWGNPTSDFAASAGVKTIYDPCPVGYRVPGRNAFGFFSNNGGDVVKASTTQDKDYTMNFDKAKTPVTYTDNAFTSFDLTTSYGFYFYTASVLSSGQTDVDRVDKTTLYFPAAGLISHDGWSRNLSFPAKNFQMASNAPAMAAFQINGVWWGGNEAFICYRNGYNYPALMQTVRCIKE